MAHTPIVISWLAKALQSMNLLVSAALARGYLEFLRSRGRLRFDALDRGLLRRVLGTREPVGHLVVLSGNERGSQACAVQVDRVIAANLSVIRPCAS